MVAVGCVEKVGYAGYGWDGLIGEGGEGGWGLYNVVSSEGRCWEIGEGGKRRRTM